jgi:hypothetical protein
MRTTTTLESVINSVHEQSANHYDNIVPVRDMRFESLVRMNIAGQSFGVSIGARWNCRRKTSTTIPARIGFK